MVSLITSNKAQKAIAQNMKALRLDKGLTQKGLSERSGVSLASLRKFEQKGKISIESFLKLSMSLGCLDKVVEATKPTDKKFTSIDDVLEKENKKKPERGWRK